MNDYMLERKKRRNQIISGFLMGLLLSLFLITMFSAPSHADVTLTWDDNSDADLYVVYVKEKGASDTTYVEIDKTEGRETSLTFKSPDVTKEFEYAVKAFNKCGNSSDFSDSVVYGECASGELIPAKVQNLQIPQSTEKPAS